MKAQIGGLVLAAALGVAGVGCVQPAPGGQSLRALAQLHARTDAVLQVASPAFQPGGEIPLNDTQYGANTFPGLTWSGAPTGTRAYVLILQDVDKVSNGRPLVHCVVLDIPPGARALPAAMTTPPPPGRYGLNYSNDNPPYAGPRPPPGPKHHYYFQLFALDGPLAVTPGASYLDLIAAMTGHVLASGEVVGVAEAPG